MFCSPGRPGYESTFEGHTRMALWHVSSFQTNHQHGGPGGLAPDAKNKGSTAFCSNWQPNNNGQHAMVTTATFHFIEPRIWWSILVKCICYLCLIPWAYIRVQCSLCVLSLQIGAGVHHSEKLLGFFYKNRNWLSNPHCPNMSLQIQSCIFTPKLQVGNSGSEQERKNKSCARHGVLG